MSLAPNTKLGSYEILSPLGAGGMGEVYRARDSKLGREVAIKVLPEEFTQHPEKLARFEREARLLAALNHPGIATLHGLEEFETKPFLVMELVEGKTLAERIAHGPLPVGEALEISRQIAEALEAAHEKGVIHRDLKPANVKVDPEGQVKVLDFGIAKAFADEVPESELSQSPTLSRDATRMGVILGTAAYMSPEQAKGKTVDKRSDIFSFGIVLFEMLTGRRAFSGDDVSDVLASIMKLEPDWKAVPSELDPRIQNLLQRCLRKDRKHRRQSIGDVRVEIQEILADPNAATAQQPLTVSARSRARERVIWGLAILAAGIGVWSLMHPSPPEPPAVKRLSIPLPPNVVLPTGLGRHLALSHDGTQLAFVGQTGADRRLFLRSLDNRTIRAIPGTEGAQHPAFSPDGVSIGFDVQRQPFIVSLAGGPRVALAEIGTYPTWAPDGTFFFWNDGLWRIPSGGGEPQAVMDSSDDAPVDPNGRPQVLPNGKAVLFQGYGESPEGISIDVLSLETGEQHSLVASGTNPQYISSGHILFARGRSQSLFAVPFDAGRLEVTGPAVPVVEDLRVEGGGAAQFAVGGDGSLVYATGSGTALKLVRVDRQGNARSITETTRQFRHPRFSPDGRRLAVSTVDAGSEDIWLLELGRGTLTRLTFEGANIWPIWSPDGERIIFASNRAEGGFNIFSKPADGSGAAEQLTTGGNRFPTSILSDGNAIVFRQGPAALWDIGMVRLQGESEPELLLHTPFIEHSGVLSPDDNWLAYVSNESGRSEIYVTPFPGPGGKLQISTEGGAEPVWSRDGRELFYWSEENLMAVTIDASPDLIPGSPVILFGAFRRLDPGVSNYDVAPDGDGFVIVQPEQDEAASTELEMVLNWDQELKRLVPTQ